MNRNTRPRLTIRNYAKRRSMAICSKSIVQILLWQALILAIYLLAIRKISGIKILSVNWFYITKHVLIETLFLVYPLGVIVGDVCLGRYKTVLLSLMIIAGSLFSSSIGAVILFAKDGISNNVSRQDNNSLADFNKNALHTASLILRFLSAPIFILGYSIFCSNVVQFGLDQLIDKPSESLGVFAHWLIWATKVCMVLIDVFYIIQNCITQDVNRVLRVINQSLPICFCALFIILLIVSWCTRHRLNHDGVLYNPYKMIYKVFRFASKHSLNPLTAFGHPELTRLDNAKECYGGPFRNSEVEDVKHFKRIIILLLSLGPIFVLTLPVNDFFLSFSEHTGHFTLNKTCGLNPDFYSNALSIFTLPIYIWVMYGLLQNRRPKILHRLVLLALLYILVAGSMLVIDTAGHLNLYTHGDTQPECIFITHNNKSDITLSMHWSVVIFPAAFNEVYYLLYATALEFIAAQSPHAMRGALIGAFYFIIGVFRSLGVLLFVPFGVNSIWSDGYLGEHPPVIGCGFGYYSACIVIAVIGFVALSFSAWRYQYRRRDALTRLLTNTPRQEYQQLN